MKRLFLAIPIVLIAFLSVWATFCGDSIEVTAESSQIPDVAKPPVLEVFIENSGSMDGYMCNGSQLKDAVYDYVSDLNRSTDTTRLYYINSQIIPYQESLKSYIKDLTPANFHQAGGNLSSTDLGGLIGKVLNRVDKNTVCMFVSDCILDLPNRDAQKFLTNCEITIKDEVINKMKRVPNLGVEILKLNSDFEGKYFYPNGADEVLSGVKRPYYIWMFGNKYQLAMLNKKVPLSRLVKYDLTGIVAFADEAVTPYEIKNSGLTGRTINPKNGVYEAVIRADFSLSNIHIRRCRRLKTSTARWSTDH